MKIKFIIIAVSSLLWESCSSQGIDMDRAIARCSDNAIEAGYIMVPTEENSYTIIENDILRARVYYDNYYSCYRDYKAFLADAFYLPGTIEYCSTVGLCKTYSLKMVDQLCFRWNFKLFALKYLVKLDKGVYNIKNKYKIDFWPYILFHCFNMDYYIYFSDMSAEWVISEVPFVYPPMPEEWDSIKLFGKYDGYSVVYGTGNEGYYEMEHRLIGAEGDTLRFCSFSPSAQEDICGFKWGNVDNYILKEGCTYRVVLFRNNFDNLGVEELSSGKYVSFQNNIHRIEQIVQE